MSLASRGLVGAVRYYQRVLSPRKPVPTCRFSPTCSEYAAQAIELHGAVKGGWLAAWRVARCNPLVPGGYDPVPDHFPAQHHSEGASNAPPPASVSQTSPPPPAPQKSPSSTPKKRRVS
ncbi:membrane protein insertion efficiency factor YidD [Deinococcus sp. AJ005]|uniref:membrane protein insertion efficiency factor YidD n=1 Tax=Deinococcus sp. AJ005 TaxID=2652443 RepID=UPI00125CCBD2|nr:membrane protein insertion efficiency factor YidD [Deinococcus sp. AJ005]